MLDSISDAALELLHTTNIPNTPVAVDIIDPLEERALEQSRYVVHLPSFEGPLDLLLHLIEKRQMEITTISLLAVTDQYLAYLAQWEAERAPLANMAAFVAIAARLLYIKSQSLLPRTSREELANEAESAVAMAEELQRHLQEYKEARQIAHYLRQRAEAGLQTFGRSGLLAGIEAQLDWVPPTLAGLDSRILTATFQRLLERLAKDASNSAAMLPLERVRVSERVAEIVNLLSRNARVLLSDVIEQETSHFVIIVTFLAVLELWKHERITVQQETLLGPILLARGERWEERAQPVQDEE